MVKKFTKFVKTYLLPVPLPFYWRNPRSVVIMDNASIHHVNAIATLVERQHKAFLPTTLFSGSHAS